MLRHEAGFFLQFPVHGFQRRLVAAHAALGKLPAVTMDAARPEQPAVCIEQYDANIRTVAICVDHPASSEPVAAVYARRQHA